MDPRPPESLDLGEVVLRRHRPADAAALAATAADCLDHLTPWMVWATPELVTVEAMATFISDSSRRAADGSEAVYGILTPAGALVGGCGLHDRGAPRTVEIGYWLHPSATGRGAMTRIVTALADLALAMDDVGAAAVVCDEANERSAAVARRAGFRLDRIVDSPRPQAPADTGRDMIWLRTAPS